VWALEQEEPQRTVAKWSRIELVADTQQQVPAQVQTVGGSDYSRPDVHMAQSQDAGHETGSMSGPTKSGADFMVPWHLPFHRANVAAAAQQAVSSSSKTPPDGPGGTPGHQQQGPPAGPRQQQGGGTAGGSGVCGSTPAQVDSQKGSVVFQRYYHLFEAGELEQLVAEVPGCACVDAFYDKSNWCVVIEHRPHGSSPQ
jgi:alkylated DNA repair protein alkB family protein 8